jgi:hypothetical protein
VTTGLCLRFQIGTLKSRHALVGVVCYAIYGEVGDLRCQFGILERGNPFKQLPRFE